MIEAVQHPNADRLRAWRDGVDCIWRRHGVWDLGPNGEPRLLEQDGWRVEYIAFEEGGTLPTRLKVSRGDLDLRFSIESWNTPR